MPVSPNDSPPKLPFKTRARIFKGRVAGRRRSTDVWNWHWTALDCAPSNVRDRGNSGLRDNALEGSWWSWPDTRGWMCG